MNGNKNTLALIYCALTLFGWGDVLNAEEHAGEFYERLAALSAGDAALSPEAQQAFEATAWDPAEGIAGIQLGMSMEDVIAVWGLPKRICMQNLATVLSIAKGSQFSFIDNALVSARIHSADLPAMSLAGGVDFSFSEEQLNAAYELRNASTRNYAADVSEGVELQFYYTNIGNQGPRMATIAIARKR